MPTSHPYPTPPLETRFHLLHVSTEVKMESQFHYSLRSTGVQISALRHATNTRPVVLGWSPWARPSHGGTILKTRLQNDVRSVALNAAQTPGLSFTSARGTTS